jgi:Spy/CpxP family protein refolding chaperone
MKLLARTLVVLGSVAFGAGFAAGNARAAMPGEESQELARGTMRAAPEMQGIFELVGEALNEADLKPEQREAAKKLGEQIAEKQHAVDVARTSLVLALADALESGKLEEGTLNAKAGALAEARLNESPVLRDSFQKLHAMMSPEQRTAFVEALEKRIKMAKEQMAPARIVDRWTKDLSLSDDQKGRVSAVLDKCAKAHEADRETAHKMLDAFRSETFDPEKIVPMKDVASRSKDRAMQLITATQEIGRILSPEQRAKAAVKIREAVGRRQRPAQPGAHRQSLKAEEVDQTEEPIIVGAPAFGRVGVLPGWGYGGVAVARTYGFGTVAYGAPFVGGFVF